MLVLVLVLRDMEETHSNMRFVIKRLRVRSMAGETVRCALRLVLSSGCEIQQYRTAGPVCMAE